MKKTILKSVVTAVVVATMALSSVAAFAGEETHTLFDYNGEKDAYFTCPSNATSTGNVDASLEFSDGSSKAISKDDKLYKLGTADKLKFSVRGTASIELYWGKKSDKGSKTYTLNIEQAGDTITDTLEGATYCKKLTAEDITGDVTISTDLDDGRLYGIRVVDVVSENSKQYKITGTSNLTEVSEFKLGEYTAKVDSDGSWTVTKEAETAPFKAGDTLVVSLAQYTAEPASITLKKGSDEYSFDGGNINFEKTKLVNLTENKEYVPADIEAGRPNFDIDGLNGSGSKYKGTLKFKLEKNAKVTLSAKSGSTNSAGYELTFTLGDIEKTLHSNVDADKEFSTYETYLAAGENELTITSEKNTLQVKYLKVEYVDDGLQSTTNGGVYVSGSTSYVIAAINDTDVDEATITIGKTPFTTDTVYKSVKIGEETIDAGQVNGQYLYAIEVKNANGNEALNDFTVS